MNRRRRSQCYITAAVLLVGASPAVMASEPAGDENTAQYLPLRLPQPIAPAVAPSAGTAEVGLGYTSDDNYRFGYYNGLPEQQVTLIGNLHWQDFQSGDNFWEVSLTDLGLDTREGKLTWGKAQRLRLSLGFDSQLQVRNDSGLTPFLGNSSLVLPGNWASGTTTGQWNALEQNLHGFDRELQRDRLFASVEARLNVNWRLQGNIAHEQKEGTGDIGAGIYVDAASADALLLPAPVDYRNTEIDLGLSYTGERLHLNGQLAYADFDNREELLSWQNPYSSFGPAVAYPAGRGALALAPDNEHTSGRLTGNYLFSQTTRLQFDASYAVTSQDQDFAGYTVNPALPLTQSLPRESLDGEVATTTASVKLLLRPMKRLNTQLFYRLRDRDYDAARAGYLYVRGDAYAPADTALTVYNSNYDLTSQTAGFELAYRLPRRSRVRFEYAYEVIERDNTAVQETEEDRYTLGYRIQPWQAFTAKIQLRYGDRAADTYQWSQSYFASLDADLINATPDNQRYSNHPLLRQFHLANRESMETRIDLAYLPAPRWGLNLNLLWRDEDFDKSELGLTANEYGHAQLGVSYAVADTLSVSAHAGYEHAVAEQASRAFRGGQEKNAFAVFVPLPQASDPAQDWELETTDAGFTAGFDLQWQASASFHLELQYNVVDTRSEQAFNTAVGGSVQAEDLPDVDTLQHQFDASGTWVLSDELSLRLNYRFHHYDSDDWAYEGVEVDTIDKVLSFGQTNPDEDIHYVGASVIYRWQ